MKLDKRITDVSKIMNCFTTEQAKEYIYTSGYFADYIEDFVDLDSLDRCELKIIESEFKYPYCIDGDSFKFFLPCEFVKEETEQKQEKKYRPYKDIEEFCNQGFQIVVMRHKQTETEFHVAYNGYRLPKDGLCMVLLGNLSYSLDDLFDNYELLDSDGVWKPFGVEE